MSESDRRSKLFNPPRLSSINYRAGTHGSFKANMLTSLSKDTILSKLTTRMNDDLAIGLLDTWATVLDILTFYQERIANEGFIRVCTERRSILELARAVGYELGSGVAASTFLAFNIEDASGAIEKTVIDALTGVQSLPGQGERPQVFETDDRIEARPEWNNLKPRIMLKQSVDSRRLYFKGTDLGLKKGDRLLFVEFREGNCEPIVFKKISKVELNEKLQQTVVYLLEDAMFFDDISVVKQPSKEKFDITEIITLSKFNLIEGDNKQEGVVKPDDVSPEVATQILNFLNSAHDAEEIADKVEFSKERDVGVKVAQNILDVRPVGGFTSLIQVDNVYHVGPERFTEIVKTFRKTMHFPQELSRSDIISSALNLNLRLDEFVKYVNSLREMVMRETDNEVYVFRLQTGIFGHNAPRFDSLPKELQDQYKNSNNDSKMVWDDPENPTPINKGSNGKFYDHGTIYLDNRYPGILPNSWIILESSLQEGVVKPDDVSPEVATQILNFLNSAHDAEEIADKVEFSKERDVGVKVAQNILDVRPVGGFTSLIQVDNVYHVGPERFTEIVKTFRKAKACAYWITGTREKTMADFLLSSKVTGLSLDAWKINLAKFLLRETTAYIQSEILELAELSDKTPVQGDSVVLGSLVDGLHEGQLVAITGELEDQPGVSRSEIATIHSVKFIIDSILYTKLNFTHKLSNKYKRSKVTLSANVAKASHGETKTEILGGGDPSQRRQEFVLKQTPLTFISAPTATGARSTLKIRVNDVIWKEKPSLYELKPAERGYIIRVEDDGQTRVIFGDGIKGACLPAGIENISAEYRIGLGKRGMLNAGQLTLLKNRPLGVRGVTNPIAPTGAEDREDLGRARKNAPLTVLTLDRIVSLEDFENCALAFQGIGKAKAIRIWDYGKEIVQLTVATVNGKPLEKTSVTHQNLVKQINASKDPLIRVRFEQFTNKLFNVEATITVVKEVNPELIKSAIVADLLKCFSFANMNFGQAITQSRIIALIQGIEGVVMVDLNYLYDSEQCKKLSNLVPEKITDLFTINPEGLKLEVIAI